MEKKKTQNPTLLLLKKNSKAKMELDIYTPLYIQQMINVFLLYSTGNSTQYSVMIYKGTESKTE